MAKVKVYGRVRDRIVLGIAHAYLAKHPDASLDELNEAFPNELNSTLKDGEIFRLAGETNGMVSCGKEVPSPGILTLANGKRIEMVVQWSDEDYSKLKEWVKKDDIEVEEPPKSMEIPGEGFSIERMEPTLNETEGKAIRGNREMTNRQKYLLYLLLTLLLLFSILLFSRGNSNDVDEITRYRNTKQTEQKIDLHRIAVEQKRREKEICDLCQDEEVRLAEEMTKSAEEALNTLIEQ